MCNIAIPRGQYLRVFSYRNCLSLKTLKTFISKNKSNNKGSFCLFLIQGPALQPRMALHTRSCYPSLFGGSTEVSQGLVEELLLGTTRTSSSVMSPSTLVGFLLSSVGTLEQELGPCFHLCGYFSAWFLASSHLSVIK